MAITITVEDGTNVANANSRQTIAAWKIYADNHGYSYAGKSDDQIATALIRATTWIDFAYRKLWPGVRTYATQTLQWPRKAGVYVYGVYDQNGYLTTVTDAEGLPIAINAIPAVLIAADAEATYRELVKPGSLSPDLPRGGAIKSVKAGSAAVEFSGTAPATTTFQMIDDLLAGLLVSSETSPYTARAVRA